MRNELAFILLGGSLFLAASLTDAYDTERHPTAEDEGDNLTLAQHATGSDDTLSDRLGYAILVDAGYADVVLPPEAQQGNAGFIITPHDDNPEIRCASTRLADPLEALAAANQTLASPAPASPDAASPDSTRPDIANSGIANPGTINPGIDGHFLLMSIVAAEKYNRSAVMRRIEEIWARTAFALTGQVPDLSLGVAQIRPSAIRTVLAQNSSAVPLSESELLDYALDDCSNVFAASLHLRSLLQSVDRALPRSQAIAAVARLYNGGDNPAYVAAVTGAYQLLDPGSDTVPDLPQAKDAPVTSFDLCVSFEAGAANGDIAWGDYAAGAEPAIRTILAKTNAVRIAMLDGQPGPASYLQRLRDQRQDWLTQTLTGFGTPAETVIYEASQDLGTNCQLQDMTAAMARLRIAVPAGLQAPAPAVLPTAPADQAPETGQDSGQPSGDAPQERDASPQ